MGGYAKILLFVITLFLTLVGGSVVAQDEEEQPILMFSGKITNSSEYEKPPHNSSHTDTLRLKFPLK